MWLSSHAKWFFMWHAHFARVFTGETPVPRQLRGTMTEVVTAPEC
jgi:hypothetical protein